MVRAHPDVAQLVEVPGRVGVAAAQLVDGEHMELFRQRDDVGVPAVAAHAHLDGAAVHQDQLLGVSFARLDVVGLVAVNRGELALELVGTVEQGFHGDASSGELHPHAYYFGGVEATGRVSADAPKPVRRKGSREEDQLREQGKNGRGESQLQNRHIALQDVDVFLQGPGDVSLHLRLEFGELPASSPP